MPAPGVTRGDRCPLHWSPLFYLSGLSRSGIGAAAGPCPPLPGLCAHTSGSGLVLPPFLGADGSLAPSLKSHLASECGPSAFDLILSSLGTEESQTGVPGGAQVNGAWTYVWIPGGCRPCQGATQTGQTQGPLAFLRLCTRCGLQLRWH